MKFTDALLNFQNEILKEYGAEHAIVKIGIEPKVYSEIMMEAHENMNYRGTKYSSFRITDAAEPKFMNTTVVPRERKAEFDSMLKAADDKERKWFNDRGYTEADLMYADAAHKKYVFNETNLPDKKPFDRSPGFRRIFMMGCLYGLYGGGK